MSDAPFFPYLVTLAYGDLKTPTLAQVVFFSDKDNEDAKTVAEALLQHSKNTEPQTPRFDWSTLRVQGTNTLSEAETSKLVDAASKGHVGVGRVSRLKLSAN